MSLTDYQIFLNRLPVLTEKDIYNNLLSQLPMWWGSQDFDTQSVLNDYLIAYVTTSFYIYSQLLFIVPQMRFGTMNDDQQIDLFAQDFFGSNLPRNSNEPNVTYKNRIFANLFNPKATRQGMINALFNLTGLNPIIFEPWRPADCGGYGGQNSSNYSMGFSTHGSYGSNSYPYQAFVTVFVNPSQSMGRYPGFDIIYGGYGGETSINYVLAYGGQSLIEGLITENEINQVINQTKVFGTIVWVRIVYATELNNEEIIFDNDDDILLDNDSDIILD